MSAAVRRSFRSSFASLQVRNYRLYFGGQIVSLAGNWMQIVAELWLILTLTDSGLAVGIATALQFTGILLFGALGGSLADRFDKRKLLMVTQTGMAVPAMLLFILALSGSAQAWMVFVVIGLRGLVLAVDNPARQAFVIELVGPDRVLNAVSLNSVLVHSARITGPAIAGVIIALSGVAPCSPSTRSASRRCSSPSTGCTRTSSTGPATIAPAATSARRSGTSSVAASCGCR